MIRFSSFLAVLLTAEAWTDLSDQGPSRA